MSHISVSIELAATPAAVWSVVADVGSHVEWMADAAEIRFTTDQRSGVGTTFDCETRVGPLRTTDRMEITTWSPAREMGVRHVGLVRGEGAFRLFPLDGGARTLFDWTEELRFPWYLGGPVAAAAAAPVLRIIWLRNLRALRTRLADG